ncbi:MAG: helix-turn-helix transcriptional regulator [Pirellulales bacterium]|nr:helix-turn-helix transcriptional regulator [Pirellulales bacterium]
MGPARKEPDQSTYSGRLAKRMIDLRTKADFSVADVVERMAKAGYEIKDMAYRHWESNRRQPDLDALPAIAKALKVRIKDLMPAR